MNILAGGTRGYTRVQWGVQHLINLMVFINHYHLSSEACTGLRSRCNFWGGIEGGNSSPKWAKKSVSFFVLSFFFFFSAYLLSLVLTFYVFHLLFLLCCFFLYLFSFYIFFWLFIIFSLFFFIYSLSIFLYSFNTWLKNIININIIHIIITYFLTYLLTLKTR
jgi:hypothetical protein